MVLLNFDKRAVLFLQLLKDPLLVLLLVLQLGYLLDVVRFFQLPAHGLDLLLVEVDLGLTLLQLFLFGLDGRIIGKLSST